MFDKTALESATTMFHVCTGSASKPAESKSMCMVMKAYAGGKGASQAEPEP